MPKIEATYTLNSAETIQILIGEKIISRALATRGKKKLIQEEEILVKHLDQSKRRFIVGYDEDKNYIFVFLGQNGKEYIGIEDTNTILPVDSVRIKKGAKYNVTKEDGNQVFIYISKTYVPESK